MRKQYTKEEIWLNIQNSDAWLRSFSCWGTRVINVGAPPKLLFSGVFGGANIEKVRKR